MKLGKKGLATAITLLLVLAMAIPLTALPSATALNSTTTTYMYIAVSMYTVGVGQQMEVYGWTNVIPPAIAYSEWKYYIDIEAPNGDKSTIGPITSDTAGSGYTYFTPDQTGVYKLQARFAGVTIPPDSPLQAGMPFQPPIDMSNDKYLPSESDVISIIVQEDEIKPYEETPLPTEFWVRPVNAINRQWVNELGYWFGTTYNAQTNGPTTNYAYGAGPESPHAMWSKPYWEGGLADPRLADGAPIDYYGGLVYETYGLWPPIIMNGKLYYNVYTPPRYGWYCVDLYTGETNYFHNTTGDFTTMGMMGTYPTGLERGRLAFGSAIYYGNPNQFGAHAYLWSTGSPAQGMHGGIGTPTSDWDLFDEFTGNYIASFANVSTGGTWMMDKMGSVVNYKITGSGSNMRLLVWNTTKAMQIPPGGDGFYRPQNVTYDGTLGYSLNVSAPAFGTGQSTIRAIRVDDAIYGGSAGSNTGASVTPGVLWKMSLAKGNEGTLLWNRTFTPPSSAGNKTISMGTVDPEDGVFLFSCVNDRKWYCYSLETMELLWASEPETSWNFYGMGNNIYQGKLLTYGYGGIMLAYNLTNGNIVWNYTATPAGLESWYGNTPISGTVIADGKIYIYSTEHSPSMPYRRDAMIRAIDADTGKELWNVTHWAITAAISDGYLVALNYYDNSVYCYGIGPSATTVTADPKVSIHGNSVLIEGTVTDQSPGGKQDSSGNLIFPLKGTPAIADEYMGKWMEYLYAQRPMPSDAKGVEVSLTTIDPNGNCYNLGNTTSDITGKFGLSFTPEVPGTYQITATFAGSKSYGPSFATTYITVDEASPAITPQEAPVNTSIADMYFVPAIIGVIMAIVIVGALLAILMIKKRP
jgi:hypothetical protein